jgi:GTP-binding protein Era
MAHKAGYVSLIGKPNAGKSTLMNALIGERLSVVNPKAQTTRHRILGILNGDDYQIVFSDTPGLIAPAYKLQARMMRVVNESLEDADILLLIDDLTNPLGTAELQVNLPSDVPIVAVLNKSDLVTEEIVNRRREEIGQFMKLSQVIVCSAATGDNVKQLHNVLVQMLPEHPPYFPKDVLTDRSTRFFVTEIIRGKLLDNFRQEVPYACEVAIEAFEEQPDIARIRAVIFVERESQKIILIGRKGEMMKKVGIEARQDIEKLVGTKVFLELRVKVRDKWRQKDDMLDHFGY